MAQTKKQKIRPSTMSEVGPIMEELRMRVTAPTKIATIVRPRTQLRTEANLIWESLLK